jgi:hypothetical protein
VFWTPIAGLLLLVVSLWAWRHAFKYAWAISNTPLTRIAGAAQGYVSVTGRGQAAEGESILEPHTGRPCLWYRIYYGDGFAEGGRKIEESDASFLLDDGSGATCVVDPDGAEMLVQRRNIPSLQYDDDQPPNQMCWSLRPGDRIYVLGEFTTVGSIMPDLDARRQTGELLAFWKKERPDLMRRFDLNGDGELSEQEWSLARAAARREVEREQQEIMAAPEAHLMRKPEDGRLYLISDREPAVLARQFWFWAIMHGTVFIATAAMLAWLYEHGRGVV